MIKPRCFIINPAFCSIKPACFIMFHGKTMVKPSIFVVKPTLFLICHGKTIQFPGKTAFFLICHGKTIHFPGKTRDFRSQFWFGQVLRRRSLWSSSPATQMTGAARVTCAEQWDWQQQETSRQEMYQWCRGGDGEMGHVHLWYV